MFLGINLVTIVLIIELFIYLSTSEQLSNVVIIDKSVAMHKVIYQSLSSWNV